MLTLFLSVLNHACVHAQSLQLCPTLCDPMDCSPPGSSVHGFPRQEHWNQLPFSSPWDLPDPGIKLIPPVSPALQVDSLPTESLQKLSLMTFVYVQPTEGKT